ncbi:MAG TPA: ABC transporter permease subunit [Bdellovibrionales bacterium]|nr:ABC transporter permease subunit [Bdellovibrionales bacterium]
MSPLVWLRVLIALFLLLPFLVLIWKLEQVGLPPGREIAAALWFTVQQASLSALLSIAFGALGALGLLKAGRARKVFESAFLIPNLFPTLFVLLACLKVFSPFPFGLAGIVLVHVAINTGLAAVAIARLLEDKVGGWAELALVEGANRRLFLPVAARYLARDLGLLFLFIFSVCFSSLTVPMVAGRFDGLTLEMLIYEKIKISGQWDQALGLAFLQTALIFGFSFLLSADRTLRSPSRRNLALLASRWGLVIPLVFSAIVVLSQLEGLAEGLRQAPVLKSELPRAAFGTLAVGGGVGLLSFLLLTLIAVSMPHRRFQKFLIGYVAPSSVLTGFALLLIELPLPPQGQMILGITLIQLPLFYRLYVDGTLESIQPQLKVAQTLGAGPWLTFRQIVFPQVAPALAAASGLAAFWACGEFALSSLLAGQNLTLALMVKSLLSSYRLEAATLLLWLLLGFGVSLWIIFWSVGYVLGAKSRT